MAQRHDDHEYGLLLLGVIGTVIMVPVLFMGMSAATGAPWADASAVTWSPVAAALLQALFAAIVVGGGYLAVRAVAGDRTDPPRRGAPAAA